MKKIWLVLILVIYTIHFAFSQISTTVLTIKNSGPQPPPCYLKDNNIWKSSHGSPCFYEHHDWLRLDAIRENGDAKSEGIFANYKFFKSNKYRIYVTLKDIKGSPAIHLYAANNLSENVDNKCNMAVLPTVADKEFIVGGAAVCSGASHCTMNIPENSFWTPKNDYTRLWITSSHDASGSTSSFVISKVVIEDYGKVNANGPSVPGNLHITGATEYTISIDWAPSVGDYKIKHYVVYCSNGQTYQSFTAYYTGTTVFGLRPCKKYKIQVEAVDVCGNVSNKATVYGETTSSLPPDIVLQKTIILSVQPQKKYIAQAKNSIIFKPGFSVKAYNTQEAFHSRISTGCNDILLISPLPEGEYQYYDENNNMFEELHISEIQPEDEETYFTEIEESNKTILDVQSYTLNDIRIYPNPTTEILTIECPNFTGRERLFLFDITGKPLLDYTIQGFTSNIDISSFSSGIYFIKIVTQDNIFMRKLIKM